MHLVKLPTDDIKAKTFIINNHMGLVTNAFVAMTLQVLVANISPFLPQCHAKKLKQMLRV
jgi:hypothetical protein